MSKLRDSGISGLKKGQTHWWNSADCLRAADSTDIIFVGGTKYSNYHLT